MQRTPRGVKLLNQSARYLRALAVSAATRKERLRLEEAADRAERRDNAPSAVNTSDEEEEEEEEEERNGNATPSDNASASDASSSGAEASFKKQRSSSSPERKKRHKLTPEERAVRRKVELERKQASRASKVEERNRKKRDAERLRESKALALKKRKEQITSSDESEGVGESPEVDVFSFKQRYTWRKAVLDSISFTQLDVDQREDAEMDDDVATSELKKMGERLEADLAFTHASEWLRTAAESCDIQDRRRRKRTATKSSKGAAAAAAAEGDASASETEDEEDAAGAVDEAKRDDAAEAAAAALVGGEAELSPLAKEVVRLQTQLDSFNPADADEDTIMRVLVSQCRGVGNTLKQAIGSRPRYEALKDRVQPRWHKLKAVLVETFAKDALHKLTDHVLRMAYEVLSDELLFSTDESVQKKRQRILDLATQKLPQVLERSAVVELRYAQRTSFDRFSWCTKQCARIEWFISLLHNELYAERRKRQSGMEEEGDDDDEEEAAKAATTSIAQDQSAINAAQQRVEQLLDARKLVSALIKDNDFLPHPDDSEAAAIPSSQEERDSSPLDALVDSAASAK